MYMYIVHGVSGCGEGVNIHVCYKCMEGVGV